MSQTLPGLFLIVYDDPKKGKAQPLTSQVLTPTGWRAMGDLRVGDAVIDPDGGVGYVEGVYPQGDREVFRVTTSDGGSTLADGEHLWTVTHKGRRSRGGSSETITTNEIRTRGVTWSGPKSAYPTDVWFLPVASPVHYETAAALPVDPYLLGVLIGDGCFRGGAVRVSTPDPEIVESVRTCVASMGLDVKRVGSTLYDYGITGNGGPNALTDALRDLGLWDKLSVEKTIPAAYLTASADARLALLRGLMDTDGDQPEKRGTAPIFNTSSPALRDQVIDLVRGLGGTARVGQTKLPKYPHKAEVRTGAPAWRVKVALPVCPFTLPKKRDRWQAPRALSRTIASIEPAGTAPCQCIRVSTKRNLYVTDDYIVTHNTTVLLRFLPHACVIGVKSAVELVARETCGFTPDWVVENIHTLPDLIAYIDWYVANGHAQSRPWLIIDDLSHICRVSAARWSAQAGPKDNFYAFRQLEQHLLLLGDRIRSTPGLIVACSMHLDEPKPEKNRAGGPEVPSVNQLQSLPGWSDIVGRGGMDPMYPDPLWQRTLFVDVQDKSWITGDRFNVCWPQTPLNLREIIRASSSGYTLPRRKGLEYQEDVAAWVRAEIVKDVSPANVERVYADVYGRFDPKYVAPKTPGEMHVQWAIQDGIAAAVIQRYHSGGVLGRLRARMAATAPPPPPPPPGAAPTPAAGAPAPVPGAAGAVPPVAPK